MEKIFQFVLLGVGLAPAYILAAQGTVLIYRGSGVVNFAQGAFGLIGAYAGYEFEQAGAPPIAALLGGVLAGAAAGALTYAIVMRRLEGASQLVRVVATLGISVFVTQGLALYYAGDSRYPKSIVSKDSVHIFGAHISRYELVLVGITLVLTAVLWAVCRYTKFGLQTSAVSENPRAAAALGHSPDLIGLINWTLGGALGALAGILISADIELSISSTGLLLVPALAAALLGRFTSFWMTVVGGLIVAIGSSLFTGYDVGTGWGDAFPFLVIVVVLLFRSSSLPARGESAARLPAIGSGRVRWPIVIAAVVVTGVVTQFLSDNGKLAMTTSMTTALICLSLTVVTGYAGQISLVQLGLAGVGGFFGTRLSAAWGLDFWASLLVGVAVAAVFGIVVGLPALRARGVNLAIVTLGLGLTIQDVILNNADLAGNEGIMTTPQPSIFGYHFDSSTHPGRYAVFCILVFAACAVMVANLRRGRVGRRLIALRANERAAVALGINTITTKLYAFVVGAGIAGLAGALIAFELPVAIFIAGNGGASFDPVTSITLFSFVIVGGLGYIGGSLFAAQIATSGIGAWILQAIFHSTTADNWLAMLGGVAAVLTVMFAPDGISAKDGDGGGRMWGPFLAFLDRHEIKRTLVAAPVLTRSESLATQPGSVLQIENLGVRFGGVVALDGVSLTVRSGEIVGLIGPNGAGKTTLMDAVSGLNRNYSGQVTLNGSRVDRDNPTKRARLGIGRSFQQPELFDDLVVEDNLRVACEPTRARNYLTDLIAPRRHELPHTAAIVVREFELEEDLGRKPSELPYGKRRLVGIARAVSASPKILLLDEPAAGLDDHEAQELAALMTRLARDRGYGILLIEHNVNLVMSVSDRVTALDFGRVIAQGMPEDVRRSPALVSAYLGGSAAGEQAEAPSLSKQTTR